MRPRHRHLLVLALGLLVATCGGSPAPLGTPTTEPSAPSPAPAATDPPSASPAEAPTATPEALIPTPAPPSADCVDGWEVPAPGSEVYEDGLELIATQMGLTGSITVQDIRTFTGPDVPWIIEPHYPVVRRWYVKGALPGEPEAGGRWIVERRSDTVAGISAVAPPDTTGYASPDWYGFVGQGPLRVVDGLPGLWAGLEYDFVTGEGDSGHPGLPDEVVGCLDGT